MSASEIAAAPVSGTGPRVIENQTPQRGIFINFPDLYLKSRLYWMPLKKKATILSRSLSFVLSPLFHSCRMPGPLNSFTSHHGKKNSQADVPLFFWHTLSVCISVVIGRETCRWSQRQSLGLFTVIKLSRAVIHDTLSKSCYHVEGKRKNLVQLSSSLNPGWLYFYLQFCLNPQALSEPCL